MKSFNDSYTQLNEEQRKAVDYIDGPLLVVAGPGTGKTQLLSLRAAQILRKTDADPSNILCKYSPSEEMAARQSLDKAQAELDAMGGASTDDYAAMASGGITPKSAESGPGETDSFDQSIKNSLDKSFLRKESFLRREILKALQEIL